MRLVITAEGAELLERDDFHRLSAAVQPGVHIEPWARPHRDDHIAIAPSVLRSLAPTDADASWHGRFDAMVEHARSRGWVDDDGAVTVHLERPV